MKVAVAAFTVLALAAAASARPMSLSLLGPGLQNYTNGGGGGFGGTLGGGIMGMEIVNGGADLRVTLAPGNALNDLVSVFVDTRSGGFVDAQMDDQADGGRRVSTNLTRDLNDVFPDMPSAPDFSIIFGNFGTVVFELNAGNTPGHLNFLIFTGTVGSVDIPLATLGGPSAINWFAAYASDSNYLSNESMPASGGLNSQGNPGFGDGSNGGLNPPPAEIVFENWNQYLVPTPGTAALMGLGGLALARRRRA